MSQQKQRAIDQHSSQAEEFADRYARYTANPYQNCFTYSRHRLEERLDSLLPGEAQGLQLLDVGCGTGHHLARLRQRGFVCSGVDGSMEMLDHAREMNPGADIRLADVEYLPFTDDSFDQVVCIEVLRYLESPARCIGELARVLRPQGQCLVTAAPLWNINGYWAVNRIAGRLPVKNLVRLKQFFNTSNQLRCLFRRAGFAQVDLYGVYFGPLNWIERLLPGMLPEFLKRWETLDKAFANHVLLREFSNMFLVHGVKE